jgi:prepilin-type N-terminal cleavage/methylation domain-containing protein
MLKFFRNNKGFTLVEILVVVIIVAILAAIAVPVYLRYVEKARATEAQSAISAIRTAYRVQRQTYGSTDNYTVEDAARDARLGRSTLNNWTFEVVGNPPAQYIATSTAEFAGGEGHQVVYDEEDARFSGYGIDVYTDDDEEEL